MDMRKKLFPGENDLASMHPALLAELHPNLNEGFDPKRTSPGTTKKVWWRCSNGHEWEAQIRHRVAGSGCPFCKGNRLIVGETDLATNRPDLAAEWHPTKNGYSTPSDFFKGSEKKVWWQCKQGHSWEALISARNRGTGCPYCSGHRAIVGETDLAAARPDIAAQWHPTKNEGLIPSNFSIGSSRKIWWICSLNHEWRATISDRSNGNGCPFCSGKKVLKGFNDLATTNPELAAQWHPTKNGEPHPTNITAGSEKSVWWMCSNNHEWQARMANRSKGRGCSVCAGQLVVAGINDLGTSQPELSLQWHPERNGELKPDSIRPGSNRKIWWVCNEGHEWRATLVNRVNGRGCPICAGKSVMAGVNDMLTTNPSLAKDWHPTKNGDLKPSDVVAGTNKLIWWVCEKGHEWRTSGGKRLAGSGCSYCSGRFVTPGETDLATANPDLAAQWHPTKNGDLTPNDFSAGSSKRVWWICHLNHEWRTSLASRTTKGSGCPVCAGKSIVQGFNDLATTNPDLAAQWHPTKNGDLTPSDVIAGSTKKFWWVCPEGHEWETSGNKRMSGRGCPTCAKFGFDAAKMGFVYFIAHRSLAARKVGIMNTGSERLQTFLQQGWELIFISREEDGNLVRKIETSVLNWIRKDNGLPPFLGIEEMGRNGGWSETFSEEGPSNHEVKLQIQALIEQHVFPSGED